MFALPRSHEKMPTIISSVTMTRILTIVMMIANLSNNEDVEMLPMRARIASSGNCTNLLHHLNDSIVTLCTSSASGQFIRTHTQHHGQLHSNHSSSLKLWPNFAPLTSLTVCISYMQMALAHPVTGNTKDNLHDRERLVSAFFQHTP